MSKVSSEAKVYVAAKKLGHKCHHAIRHIDRSHSNFAGSNVPPLTKEQWDKAMAPSHKYKNMSAW